MVISANFDKLYLVNLCLIFVGSVVNLGAKYQKYECIGLISDQNWSFSWMPNLLIQCYQNSTVQVSLSFQMLDFYSTNHIFNHHSRLSNYVLCSILHSCLQISLTLLTFWRFHIERGRNSSLWDAEICLCLGPIHLSNFSCSQNCKHN